MANFECLCGLPREIWSALAGQCSVLSELTGWATRQSMDPDATLRVPVRRNQCRKLGYAITQYAFKPGLMCGQPSRAKWESDRVSFEAMSFLAITVFFLYTSCFSTSEGEHLLVLYSIFLITALRR